MAGSENDLRMCINKLKYKMPPYLIASNNHHFMIAYLIQFQTKCLYNQTAELLDARWSRCYKMPVQSDNPTSNI